MAALKLVGLCGSLRAESWNRKLMQEAARHFGEADFHEADLRFPLFDEDIENADGIPEAVQATAGAIAGADAVVIASPEYNKSISGVLKNALDWISRIDGNPWRDKPVAIMSANAGRAGGERGQFALRLCLMPFRPIVLPGPEVLIAAPQKEFDEHGRLSGKFAQDLLAELMGDLRKAAGG